MARTQASNYHGANSTGKTGNASGSDVREATGDPVSGARGKHPPPKIFTSPQTQKKAASRRTSRRGRQSDRGDYGNT